MFVAPILNFVYACSTIIFLRRFDNHVGRYYLLISNYGQSAGVMLDYWCTATPTLFQILKLFSFLRIYVFSISIGETGIFHQCIDGTDMFPPTVMQMHTGSTNNHVSQIFFVLAAPEKC
jgi:hypothetical protein